MGWKEKYPMACAAAILGMAGLAYADSGSVAVQNAETVTAMR